MSVTADRILDLIDGGLQTSADRGYGTDHAPHRCARCQRQDPAEGGDLCTGCRAFLLEDTDEDPRRPIRGFSGDQVIFDECTAFEGNGALFRHMFGPHAHAGNTYLQGGVAEVEGQVERIVGQVDGYVVTYDLSPVQRHAQAMGAQWAEAVRRLTTALQTVDLEPLLEGMRRIAAQAQPETPAAAERRRHGPAATCPRHGPTRGGTCMKCARGSRS